MERYVQQIMLGKKISDKQDALTCLERIKKAGYAGLELNHFMIHPSSLFVKMLTSFAGMSVGNGGKLDWVSLRKEASFQVIGLHVDLGTLKEDPDDIIRQAKDFDTHNVIITGMYNFAYQDLNEVKKLAQELNEQGRILKENGLDLLYHNHNVELLNVTKDKKAYDILMEETDPEYLNFEFDSFWFADGGADPKIWMKKLGSRMKLWHINDRGSRLNKKAVTPIIKQDSMELGTGNLDLEGMKKIASDNKVEAIILESHKNWIDHDPLRSLEVSAAWFDKTSD